jgi:tRNA threonylcarbamoyladenosine biosynthesis protein TsaE
MIGGTDLIDAAATEAWGRMLAAVIAIGDVVTLSGPLGAGKTSLARGVLAGLGLEGEVPSPSFPIVIAYAPPELRIPLWHVDLYRIEHPDELEELGLLEARDEAALLVEWPERAGGLWRDALDLSIADDPAGGRRLTWTVPEPWKGRWPPAR